MNKDDKPLLDPKVVDMRQLFTCAGVMRENDMHINPVAEGAPSLARLGCKWVLVAMAEKDLQRKRRRVYCKPLKGKWVGGE